MLLQMLQDPVEIDEIMQIEKEAVSIAEATVKGRVRIAGAGRTKSVVVKLFLWRKWQEKGEGGEDQDSIGRLLQVWH